MLSEELNEIDQMSLIRYRDKRTSDLLHTNISHWNIFSFLLYRRGPWTRKIFDWIRSSYAAAKFTADYLLIEHSATNKQPKHCTFILAFSFFNTWHLIDRVPDHLRDRPLTYKVLFSFIDSCIHFATPFHVFKYFSLYLLYARTSAQFRRLSSPLFTTPYDKSSNQHIAKYLEMAGLIYWAGSSSPSTSTSMAALRALRPNLLG